MTEPVGTLNRVMCARKRLIFDVTALINFSFTDVAPYCLFADGGAKRRPAWRDISHALVNYPVEYARYRWGWSQHKTKAWLFFTSVVVFGAIGGAVTWLVS